MGIEPMPATSVLEWFAEPQTLRRFFQLFTNNKAFLSIFYSKFLLEKVFLNTVTTICVNASLIACVHQGSILL